MQRTRILLGQLPPILADLVRQLLNEATEVCHTTSTAVADLIAATDESNADVVVAVLGEGVSAADVSLALSRQHPGIALIVLDERGRAGARYIDGCVDSATDDLSPHTLRRLVRPPDTFR